MPTPTYDLIASTVLSTTSSSITFSSISSSYRDLILVINGSADGAELRVRVNGDTGTNYNGVLMQGRVASTGSDTWSSFGYGYCQNAYASSIFTFEFLDYSATDKHKNWLWRASSASTSGYLVLGSNRWASTSAINSINVYNAQWSAGATFYLYGIVS